MNFYIGWSRRCYFVRKVNFGFDGDKNHWHKATPVCNSDKQKRFPAVLDKNSGVKIFYVKRCDSLKKVFYLIVL